MDKTAQVLNEQFRLLRVSINAMLSANPPLKGGRVITIVSARPDDGRSFIAFGLASAYADSGLKTALIDQTFAYNSDLRIDHQDGFFNPRSPVTMPFPETSPHGQHDAHAMIAEVQRSFDVVIVAADAVKPSESLLSFIDASRGVLIAVKHGRKHTAQDTELAQLLHKLGTPIIGTVPTGPEAHAFKSHSHAPSVVPVVSGITAPQTA